MGMPSTPLPRVAVNHIASACPRVAHSRANPVTKGKPKGGPRDPSVRSEPRRRSPYRSGRSPDWLKMKNSAAPAVKREAEEDWSKERRR